MRKLIGILGLLLIAAILTTGFLAYFVVSFDKATRIWSDGLGRQLTKSPVIVSWLFNQGEWPGLAWFLADFAIFWGGGAIAIVMMRWGFRLSSIPPSTG